jgi:outer membrane protein assembly factor BamB
VRWKTPLPGRGYSSPIVSGGRVFLTTAVAHISILPEWSHRWGGDSLYRLALFALCLLALYAGIEPLFGWPRGTPAVRARLLGAGLFLSVVFAALALARWLVRAYPEIPVIGSPEIWSASLPLAEGLPPQHDLWAMAGVLAGLLLWTIGSLRNGETRLGDRLNGLLLAAATGAFFGLALLEVSLILPPRPAGWILAYWTHMGVICAAGLLAVGGAFSSSRRWGLAIGGAALLVLGFLLYGPPRDPLAWFDRWGRVRYIVVFAVAATGIAWFMIRSRRRGAAVASSLHLFRTALCVLTLLLLAAVTLKSFVPEPAFRRGVVALDRVTGGILWHTVCATDRAPVDLHWRNTAATSTPVTDGRHVFADFAGAGTCALDYSGRIVWRRAEPKPPMHWGPASSPVLWEDLLILSRDTDERGYTLALDTATGNTRWKAKRRNMELQRFETQDGYGTPVIANRPSGPQLVHYSSRQVNAYDPATGETLWSVNSSMGEFRDMRFAEQIVPSPVAAGDFIVIAGSCYQPKHISALRLNENNGGAEPELAWESNRSIPGCSSPVVAGGLVFAVTNGGIASCRDLVSGDLLARTRLPPGDYYPSITAGDGKLYITSLQGETTVLEASSGMRELSLNRLDEEVYASLAISRGEIFIRGVKSLYCIR